MSKIMELPGFEVRKITTYFWKNHFEEKIVWKNIQAGMPSGKTLQKTKKFLINLFLFFNSNQILGDGVKGALYKAKKKKKR